MKAKGKNGEEVEISAKEVVIASGGFGGIRMAWKAGAGHLGENVTQYFWAKFTDEETQKISSAGVKDWYNLTKMQRYPFLRVNLNSDRFGDETNVTLYAIHGAEIHMQPKETEFVIADQNLIDRVRKDGFASIEEQYRNFKWPKREFFYEFNLPNDTDVLSRQENTPYELGKFLDRFVGTTNTVYKADSLDDLAKQIGVDAKHLKSTAAQYNKAVETSKDELFFADTKRLVSVTKAPFYEVRFTARTSARSAASALTTCSRL